MMKKRLRQTLLLALAAALLLSCFGCGKQEESAGETGGTSQQEEAASNSDGLFTLNYSASDGLNPYVTTNVWNQTVCQLVYETLTEVDEAYTAQPRLFTQWTTENGVDWVFTVDTTRVFHDGHILTAQDAAYSIQCARDSSLYSARLKAIEEVAAQEDGTVKVTLSAANTQLPVLLNIPVIENNALGSTYPSGTGPYRYGEGYTNLVQFADHPDAASMPVDTIYLKEYTSMEEIINAFDDKLLDLVLNDPTSDIDLSFSSVNETRQYSTTNLQYVGFNTNSSFFLNSAYRSALRCAIDRAYAVSLLGDAAVATALPVHPVSPLYNEQLAATMEYDLDACRTALDACKVVDYDGDGKREFMAGETDVQEISLTFLVCSDSAEKTGMAKKIAEDLESLGLSVTVKALGWDNYCKALSEGKFDLYYGEVKLSADFDLSALLRAGGSMNYGGVTNSGYGDVIDAYLAASDDGRQAACDAMLQYVADNAPILPVCFEKHEVCTHRGTVGGFAPTQYNIFYNLTNWTIDLT